MRTNGITGRIVLFAAVFALAWSWQSEAAEISLSANGSAQAVISLPAQPTPQERKSAEELKLWLGKMTGADFKIAGEAPGPVISVGKTARFLSECSAENQKDLGNEGYGIAIKNGSVFLYGGKMRGPLYAVMSLLEDDLGCRWYTPQCTVIPKRPELKINITDRSFVPPFEDREAYFFTAVNKDWALHNRANPEWFKLPPEWGGSIVSPNNSGWNVHTMFRLLPDDPYFRTNPECFPMRSGQRVPMKKSDGPQPCLSNPKVTEIITANALDAMKKNPQANFLSISENDSTHWCECPACMAELKSGLSRADQMMRLVNAVAAQVRPQFTNVTVSALAYLDTYMPPRKINPDPALRIQLCTDKHAFRWPHLAIDETKDFFVALQAWHKLGVHAYIWDYNVDFKDYLKPRANMEVVSKNIRLYRDYGVRGVMLQGAYQCPGGADAEMKSWVWTHLLWNPDLDWKTLQQDFVRGYYGEAAGAMQAYYDLLDASWEKWHSLARRGDDMTFDEDFIASAEKLFADAEKAVTNNPALLNRVLLAELPIIQLRLLAAGTSSKAVPAAEYPRYEQLLAKFEKIGKNNNVKLVREGGLRSKFEVRVWELRTMVFGRKVNLDRNVATVAEEFVTDLWCGAKIVPDEKAENGYAVSQPPAGSEWSVQWKPEPENLGKTYSVRVRMRFDMNNPSGTVLHTGVYSPDSKLVRMEKLLAAQKIGDYAWYELGTVTLRAGDLIFIAPINNPNVSAMYFDRLELKNATAQTERK